MDTITVGRIVHYRYHDGQDIPAIVTKVWNQTTVNLTLFPDHFSANPAWVESVLEGTGEGTWHWPARD